MGRKAWIVAVCDTDHVLFLILIYFRDKLHSFYILDFDNDILGEQDVCHKEQAVGLNWKTTNAGTFDEIPCPKKAKGKVPNSLAARGDDFFVNLSIYLQVWREENVQLNHIGFYRTLVPV